MEETLRICRDQDVLKEYMDRRVVPVIPNIFNLQNQFVLGFSGQVALHGSEDLNQINTLIEKLRRMRRNFSNKILTFFSGTTIIGLNSCDKYVTSIQLEMMYMIARKQYLNQLIDFMWDGQVKVITGIPDILFHPLPVRDFIAGHGLYPGCR